MKIETGETTIAIDADSLLIKTRVAGTDIEIQFVGKRPLIPKSFVLLKFGVFSTKIEIEGEEDATS